VSADMTYPEWEKSFVDGDKSGLQEVKKDDTINVKSGTLETSLGKDHTDELTKRLDNAPDNIKRVWNNYVDDLKVISTNYTGGAHYSPLQKGININLEKVAKDQLTAFSKVSEVYQKAYGSVFHEFGHNIDALYHKKMGYPSSKYVGDVFESTKYKGYTLTEMLKEEANSYIKSVHDGLKQNNPSISIYSAHGKIKSEIFSKPAIAQRDISDIWGGVTDNVIVGTFKHSDKYWKNRSVAGEAFAEMFDATINNPDSLVEIKKYFPKSYEVFLEIIEEMAR